MAQNSLKDLSVGWIGTGRMGFAMASRLLDAGADVTAWNRTRAKAEPLMEKGGKVVDSPTELADCDVVFTMVGGPKDFEEVAMGEHGVLSQGGQTPGMLIDCTSINEESSKKVRDYAKGVGTEMIDAPVSGNHHVVVAGKLSIVASGDAASFEKARPFLEAIGRGVSYVGEGELARMVKICHNVMLGVVAQNMAEITVLAEKGGVPRQAFLDFINNSVMGSMFTTYKTPAFVNLDMTPTFTPPLLRKDMDLGLSAARELGVPMPVTAAARECVQSIIGQGYLEEDFATLLLHEAANAGLDISSEEKDVDTGL
ncbi:MAG: 6-phosphogluconate dehydrogenase [Rhodospirillaceae bacterium]|nr:6-phosphogluconate dehydrogenase [Rhodospirillaceae bacterium]